MNILVGYDGSNVANDALHLALKHSQALGANMHVVQVLNSKSEPVLSNETSMVEREAERIRDIERELEEVKSLIEKEHISCETHLLVHGLSPGEDLVQFANESAIDFIFMGIRRRSKVGKLIFGSTAQYVILNAPCPVVTIK